MSELHVLYRFFNGAGELLYVGITNDPHHRFRCHQARKSWFGEVVTATMQHFGSREELAVAETAAVTNETPKYNRTPHGGAGRPEIGQPINIRLGDKLLAAVDAKAARLGITRVELIRQILADHLAGEMDT